MSNENSFGEKLPYITRAQEQYLMDREESKKYINPFRNHIQQIEKWRKKLESPEASWDLAALIASGKQFPYPFPVQKDGVSTIETRYKIPDNELLIGFKTFQVLISLYSFCGEYTFAKWKDTVRCKEYFYFAAYCEEKLCHWPQEDQYLITMYAVSLKAIDKFMMAVIADAEDSFVHTLGDILMLPEHNLKKQRYANPIGKATIFLAYGDDKEARRHAKQLLALENTAKKRPKTWLSYAQGLMAVLDGDTEGVNNALYNYISCLRGTGEPDKYGDAPVLLANYAVFLAKMAVRRGLEVTIDTIDCPKELMQTVPMDYSHLDLPRPKYGFPWEK